MANQPMGRKLLPNFHVGNIIESAVENGDVAEDLVCKEQFEAWKKEALAGNGQAEVEVAKKYKKGTEEIRVSQSEAYKWWERAAELDERLGLLMCGFPVNEVYYLAEAARCGSCTACFILGELYSEGQRVPENKEQAL